MPGVARPNLSTQLRGQFGDMPLPEATTARRKMDGTENWSRDELTELHTKPWAADGPREGANGRQPTTIGER